MINSREFKTCQQEVMAQFKYLCEQITTTKIGSRKKELYNSWSKSLVESEEKFHAQEARLIAFIENVSGEALLSFAKLPIKSNKNGIDFILECLADMGDLQSINMLNKIQTKERLNCILSAKNKYLERVIRKFGLNKIAEIVVEYKPDSREAKQAEPHAENKFYFRVLEIYYSEKTDMPFLAGSDSIFLFTKLNPKTFYDFCSATHSINRCARLFRGIFNNSNVDYIEGSVKILFNKMGRFFIVKLMSFASQYLWTDPSLTTANTVENIVNFHPDRDALEKIKQLVNPFLQMCTGGSPSDLSTPSSYVEFFTSALNDAANQDASLDNSNFVVALSCILKNLRMQNKKEPFTFSDKVSYAVGLQLLVMLLLQENKRSNHGLVSKELFQKRHPTFDNESKYIQNNFKVLFNLDLKELPNISYKQLALYVAMDENMVYGILTNKTLKRHQLAHDLLGESHRVAQMKKDGINAEILNPQLMEIRGLHILRKIVTREDGIADEQSIEFLRGRVSERQIIKESKDSFFAVHGLFSHASSLDTIDGMWSHHDDKNFLKTTINLAIEGIIEILDQITDTELAKNAEARFQDIKPNENLDSLFEQLERHLSSLQISHLKKLINLYQNDLKELNENDDREYKIHAHKGC